jgi:hypothetical protein
MTEQAATSSEVQRVEQAGAIAAEQLRVAIQIVADAGHPGNDMLIAAVVGAIAIVYQTRSASYA